MKAREAKIPKSVGAELRIPEALDRLIDFCTATSKPDEVKKWRAERAKYIRCQAGEARELSPSPWYDASGGVAIPIHNWKRVPTTIYRFPS